MILRKDCGFGLTYQLTRMPAAVHIVEDDPAVRDAAMELVARDGRRVFAYESPAAFLAAPIPCPQDIVVLDVHFPNGSGVETAEMIRCVLPDIRIVVISGMRGPQFERALASIAPIASFRKPLDGAAFADCIDRLAT